jgi:hypothetical protein
MSIFESFLGGYTVPNGINGADATFDNRTAIQSAIDTVSSAGGGLVYLPKGTFMLSGTGTANEGALRLKSNVTLQGSGIGATILKILDDQAEDVTGVVRTTSGEITTNVGLKDLTIDGNKAGQTTISITLTQAAGTATAVVAAEDRPAVDDEIYIIGSDQTEYLNYQKVLTTPTATTFTFAVDAGATSPATGTITFGKAIDGFFCGVTPAGTDEDNNVVVENVEIKNCTRYGFDPHEETRNLKHINCKSHANGLDGFVADFIEDGLWLNCEAYDNGRHGLNITGKCDNVKFIGCDSYDNGDNGLVANKSGSNKEPRKISILGCNFYSNDKENVVIREAFDITYIGGSNYEAERDGLTLKGCQRLTVDNVSFVDNGQAANNTYADIVLIQEDGSTPAKDNTIGAGNTYSATAANKVKYHIEETTDTTNNNRLNLGQNTGAATAAMLLGDSAITAAGAINLDAPYTSLSVASGTYAVTLAAPTIAQSGKIKVIEMIDASGTSVTLALTNVIGGSAGSSALFDAVNETLTLVAVSNKWVVLDEHGVTLS